MSAQSDNPPAFPCEVFADAVFDHELQRTIVDTQSMPGMTLHDYFAAHAPACPTWWVDAHVGKAKHQEPMNIQDAADVIALWRWRYADSMLKARQS